MNNNKFTIISFYQFKKIRNSEKVQIILKDLCFFHKIKGTIILAKEGINGTIAGFDTSIRLILEKLKKIGFDNLQVKKSLYQFMPFNRLKIKVKKELVTFDGNHYNYGNYTAKHLNNKNWNKLIKNKNTLLIDVRNDFENKMGTFKNSINPKTKSFSEFKKYINTLSLKDKGKKIAMFCTGGIRCEKASSYMLNQGFKNLYQLDGGILNYLAQVPKKESLWQGECFVFDNRVSIKNGLSKGTYSLCHGCRMPINSKEKKSYKYEEGVSCSSCYNKLSSDKKKRLRERNKQIKISKKKGIYNPYIRLTTFDYS